VNLKKKRGIRMAICYNCGDYFYGDECSSCGWTASYKCWCCKTRITPKYDEVIKCSICGWFTCPSCEQCGCNEDRPQSNEEKIEGELYE